MMGGRQKMSNEHLLEDEYPVYADYWYLIDGIPKRSPIEGNVRELKWTMKAKEICRCDAVNRDLPISFED